MINRDQTIPCPTCKTLIPFDTQQLLMGVQFECPSCHSVIGLAAETKPIAIDTLEKLEELKRRISK